MSPLEQRRFACVTPGVGHAKIVDGAESIYANDFSAIRWGRAGEMRGDSASWTHRSASN
jgi:hypothetical protein